MTEPATARIIEKKNDPAYLPLVIDNKLNDSYSYINWAKYEFEVDGKIYYGYDAVHPLQGKKLKILYNPEDPSENRSKYSVLINRTHRPLFIILIAVLIPVILIFVLSLFGITFW